MKFIVAVPLLMLICVGCTHRAAGQYAEEIRNEMKMENLNVSDVESKVNKPHTLHDFDEGISTMEWEFEGEKPSVLVVYYNRLTKIVTNVGIAKPWAARIPPDPK